MAGAPVKASFPACLRLQDIHALPACCHPFSLRGNFNPTCAGGRDIAATTPLPCPSAAMDAKAVLWHDVGYALFMLPPQRHSPRTSGIRSPPNFVTLETVLRIYAISLHPTPLAPLFLAFSSACDTEATFSRASRNYGGTTDCLNLRALAAGTSRAVVARRRWLIFSRAGGCATRVISTDAPFFTLYYTQLTDVAVVRAGALTWLTLLLFTAARSSGGTLYSLRFS